MSVEIDEQGAFESHAAASLEAYIDDFLANEVTIWDRWEDIPFETLSQIILAYNAGEIQPFESFLRLIPIPIPGSGKQGPCSGATVIECLQEEYNIQFNFGDGLSEQAQRALAAEINAGVFHLSERLFDVCMSDVGYCLQYIIRDESLTEDDITPEMIFRKVFTDDTLPFIIFDIVNRPGGAALLTTGGTNTIAGGMDFSNVGAYVFNGPANASNFPITRYLITHELQHILSWRTGGSNNRGSNLYAAESELRAFLGADLTFSASRRSPFIGGFTGFYPNDYGLSMGLNNWGEVPDDPNDTEEITKALEEIATELVNIWLWQGEDALLREAGTILGFNLETPEGAFISEYIDRNMLYWLALASSPDCNARQPCDQADVPRPESSRGGADDTE